MDIRSVAQTRTACAAGGAPIMLGCKLRPRRPRSFAQPSLATARAADTATTSASAPTARQLSDAASYSQPVPRSIHEVDNGNILGYGANLEEGHPGYNDLAYKRRRSWIAQLAKSHVIGTPIPEIAYLPGELATWRYVILQLQDLVPRHACQEFVEAYKSFNFDPDRIPQLQEVHERLQKATGWHVRPVAGLMHPRDFLNGLAFKHFHSTQYIRHHGNPVYTPEPDLIHELLGHVPMLLNADFCALVEAIGKASLGATDKEIWHLTKVYWYTVEFGVVMQSGMTKAFGAGILSSYGELEWMGSGKADIQPLDPWKPLPKMSYKDGFQQQYFSLDSFQAGAALLKRYSARLIANRSTC